MAVYDLIRPEDCEITSFPIREVGGQHVYSRECGVQIVHKPSGLIATSVNGRSQWINRQIALDMILAGLTYPKA